MTKLLFPHHNFTSLVLMREESSFALCFWLPPFITWLLGSGKREERRSVGGRKEGGRSGWRIACRSVGGGNGWRGRGREKKRGKEGG